MTVYVARPSGLLAAFDPPELTIAAAIERGWQQSGALLLPKPDEYLPTYPLPGAFAVPGRLGNYIRSHPDAFACVGPLTYL